MKSFKRSKGLRLLALLTLVMLACATAVAENGDKAPEEKEVLTTLEQRMQKRIDKLEFRQEPIDNVIAMIAKYADLDVIVSPEVEAEVTVTLTDVPLGEALNHILAAHGFGYIKGENLIRIVPLKEITEAPERMVSKIYRITYANVKEVEAAVGKFISREGSISSSVGTSHIIVTDYESRIKAIDTFIEQIDRITPQILVEVRIYDITTQDTLDIGVEWNLGRGTTYDSTGGITSVGENPTAGDRNPFVTGLFENATTKTGSSSTGVLRLGFLDSEVDVDMALKAQEETTEAKLLANPRILVLDNEQALFNIVREIPYKLTSTTGNTSTETIMFKDVGVELSVTPHIARDGMIRLHIIPKFGVVVSTDAITHVPTVDTRMVDTIALVRDGQTVVLGGMRKKDVGMQKNKIPLLGDLPLIGGLFRFEGEDTTITELVVFITPRIIETPVMAPSELRAYEATEFAVPEPSLTKAEEAVEEAKKKESE